MEKANIDLIMICAGSQGPSDKNHVPLGLLYIGTQLDKLGYKVKIWHILPNEFNTTIQKIKDRQPLWIGLSVLTGVTTYYAAQLSRMIKTLIPDSPIVWGGHHPSAVPNECIKEKYIDFVIVGEGEETAVEFSNALLSGTGYSNILGLGYKDTHDNSKVNPDRPLVKDLDKFELNWELINIYDYKRNNFHGKTPINFYSSRGCPYNCTFCSTPLYTGKSFRSHSPQYVARNLGYLNEKYGFNSVFFSDDNFMIHNDRGFDIITMLAKQNITVDTVDVRINQINESMVSKFKEYGVSGIFFGYESGNDRILSMIKKDITVEQTKEKVHLIKKYGIPVWASGIIGLPTETKKEIYTTIDFALWLKDNLPDLSTAVAFRYMPLPATKLMNLAIQEGFKYPVSTEDWRKIDPKEPFYKMSEWIKWMSPSDEKYFAFVQEVSINRMTDYIHNRHFFVNLLNNLFVSMTRKKVTKRKSNSAVLYKCFDFTRKIYGKLFFGKHVVKTTGAMKKHSPPSE